MRLDKYLVDCGVGSRSEIKKLIKRGEVTISGTETVKPETRIDEEKVTVYVKGTEIKYRKHVYFMLNKPAGYVSATRDLKNRL